MVFFLDMVRGPDLPQGLVYLIAVSLIILTKSLVLHLFRFRSFTQSLLLVSAASVLSLGFGIFIYLVAGGGNLGAAMVLFIAIVVDGFIYMVYRGYASAGKVWLLALIGNVAALAVLSLVFYLGIFFS